VGGRNYARFQRLANALRDELRGLRGCDLNVIETPRFVTNALVDITLPFDFD
jgi:hypothetical protein